MRLTSSRNMHGHKNVLKYFAVFTIFTWIIIPLSDHHFNTHNCDVMSAWGIWGSDEFHLNLQHIYFSPQFTIFLQGRNSCFQKAATCNRNILTHVNDFQDKESFHMKHNVISHWHFKNTQQLLKEWKTQCIETVNYVRL